MFAAFSFLGLSQVEISLEMNSRRSVNPVAISVPYLEEFEQMPNSSRYSIWHYSTRVVVSAQKTERERAAEAVGNRGLRRLRALILGIGDVISV